MEWRNIYRGFAMGTSDLVPGISGGTIAVLLGIYDELIAAVNGLFSKQWRSNLRFLIPLGFGMGSAIYILSGVMKWLIETYPAPTYFLFIGLIIGIIPYLFTEADAKHTFNLRHIILILIGVGLISALIPFVNPFGDVDEGVIIVNKSASTYILLFISGFLASAAMILPGISGSMVFLVLGVYPTVLAAVEHLDFLIILIVGTGVFIGLVSMSKIIHFFLFHYHSFTFAVIIGFVIGSIFVIFPGWPATVPVLLTSITTFAAGLGVAYVLAKIEHE